jgi:hypothetical protein
MAGEIDTQVPATMARKAARSVRRLLLHQRLQQGIKSRSQKAPVAKKTKATAVAIATGCCSDHPISGDDSGGAH